MISKNHMNEYPQNRAYAIIPIDDVENSIGDVLDIIHKSLNKKFAVWDFDSGNEKILNKLQENKNIKILNHTQAKELMLSKEWANPLENAD